MIDLNNLSIYTLKERPNLYKDLIKLIEEGFGYVENYSFQEDFAPLVHESNYENLYMIVSDETDVLAHVGFLPKNILYKDKRYPIVMCGGIVTKPEAQGKGLFRKLFAHALAQYNPMFFLLWGNEEELYKKFDFYYGGRIFQNHSTTLLPEGFDQKEWQQLSDDQFETIKAAYQKQSEEFWVIERTKKDWKILKQIESTQIWLGPNQEYCLMGKGKDLTGIIHEASPMNSFKDTNYWLPLETETSQLSPLGLFKLGDPQLLNEFCQYISAGRLKVIGIDENVIIEFNTEKLKISIEDFITGLFGPVPLTDFESFSPTFYISGLDSI